MCTGSSDVGGPGSSRARSPGRGCQGEHSPEDPVSLQVKEEQEKEKGKGREGPQTAQTQFLSCAVTDDGSKKTDGYLERKLKENRMGVGEQLRQGVPRRLGGEGNRGDI